MTMTRGKFLSSLGRTIISRGILHQNSFSDRRRKRQTFLGSVIPSHSLVFLCCLNRKLNRLHGRLHFFFLFCHNKLHEQQPLHLHHLHQTNIRKKTRVRPGVPQTNTTDTIFYCHQVRLHHQTKSFFQTSILQRTLSLSLHREQQTNSFLDKENSEVTKSFSTQRTANKLLSLRREQ